MIPELFERSPAAGATLTLSVIAVFWVVFRAVRAAVRTVGQFFEWVTDSRDRIVRTCYTLAAVLTICGTTTTGFGISRIASAPDKPITDQERRQKFMSDLAARMSGTSNKDCLEALKTLAATYDSQQRPNTAAVTLVAAPETEPQPPVNHPPGAPLVAGGIGALIVALLVTARTSTKYD